MSATRTIAARLGHSFQQLDLRGKITAALLGASLFLGLVITLTVYVAARYQIGAQSQSLLEARGRLEEREIELALRRTADLAGWLDAVARARAGRPTPWRIPGAARPTWSPCCATRNWASPVRSWWSSITGVAPSPPAPGPQATSARIHPSSP